MASKTGSFLRKSDRQKILRDLTHQGELDLAPESVRTEAAEALQQATKGDTHHQTQCKTVPDQEPFGTGCLACGEDDDHANLLLCETCEAEYHTYCLEPPLRSVPTGDWFCPECKARTKHLDEDGLDTLIEALSPCFTSRFGEVCWAQGGVGFGWWPAFIYDPRWTIGNARQLAKKNLGKRHLVYFFECHDAPFSVVPTTKITKWEDGLVDDFHLGKTARGAGQKRSKLFQQALQAATLEAQKPIEMRMDWNHSDQPQILPSPHPKKVPQPRKRQRREISPIKPRPSLEKATRSKPKRSKPPKGFPLSPTTHDAMSQVPTQRNLSLALEGLLVAAASRSRRMVPPVNPIVEPAEDGPLFVKLLQKLRLPLEDADGRPLPPTTNTDPKKMAALKPCRNVGFVKLDSLKSSTFADARATIQTDLESFLQNGNTEWRFFVPGLGPVSLRQESTLGPLYTFLRQTTTDPHLGDGTLLQPLKVFVVEREEEPLGNKTISTTTTTTAPTETPAVASASAS